MRAREPQVAGRAAESTAGLGSGGWRRGAAAHRSDDEMEVDHGGEDVAARPHDPAATALLACGELQAQLAGLALQLPDVFLSGLSNFER